MDEPVPGGSSPENVPPTTRHVQGHGATGGRFSTRPTPPGTWPTWSSGPAWHPVVNGTRLIATLLAFFSRRRRRGACARRTARPAAAYAHPHSGTRRCFRRGLAGAVAFGVAGSSRSGGSWFPSSLLGPFWWSRTTSRSSVVHPQRRRVRRQLGCLSGADRLRRTDRDAGATPR